MAQINIALLGGDKREIEVARTLLHWCRLRCFGLPVQDLPKAQGLLAAKTLAEALNGADAVILPMAGVRENGLLYAPLVGEIEVREEDFVQIKAGTPVLVGVASNYLKKICARFSLPLFEVAEHDLVAIPNAVPTAEGALLYLLRETEKTISGMRVLVLGFGRVGEAVSLRLSSLGAKVWVANRGESRSAKAKAMGLNVLPWGNWQEVLADCDAVVNTVPVPLLGRQELAQLGSGAIVLDLASGAGGVDYAAAADLGVKAIHALSLPGKVAPVSAGQILGGIYPKYLREICGLPLADKPNGKIGMECEVERECEVEKKYGVDREKERR